ncbi:MAG TPA: hypothetical protein VHV50_10715 [Actinomycetota bacterium]|nr:hypothetical protein [Actinomycetota bacterium]
MQAGTFTAALSSQRVDQLQAEVRAQRSARAVQERQRQHVTKRAAYVYRKALGAVALGLLLVVGMATAALAMPQAPEPAHLAKGAAHLAKGAAHAARHVPDVVGLGSGGNAWVAVTALVVVVSLLGPLAARSRRATA